MNTAIRPLPLVALIATFFWSASAYAQASDIAKKLLEEAKKLKEEGKIAEACPLLDRSYEMDAKDGVLFARANCRDEERKIAAAVNLYEAYLRAFSRMTGATRDAHAERAATAEGRVKELAPLVPMMKFVWAQPPPTDTKIAIDGVEFRASTLDLRLPIEPGTHEIVVRLPGEPERKRSVTLAEGDSTIVDLTPLLVSPKPVDIVKRPPSFVQAPRRSKPATAAQRKADPWKVGGFVGVGLGVAGVIVGSVAGRIAVTEKGTVEAHCNGAHQCDRTGIAAVDRFQTIGNASTAAFIAGGVLMSTGATLLVVAYRNPVASTTARVRLHIGTNNAQIGIDGAF